MPKKIHHEKQGHKLKNEMLLRGLQNSPLGMYICASIASVFSCVDQYYYTVENKSLFLCLRTIIVPALLTRRKITKFIL